MKLKSLFLACCLAFVVFSSGCSEDKKKNTDAAQDYTYSNYWNDYNTNDYNYNYNYDDYYNYYDDYNDDNSILDSLVPGFVDLAMSATGLDNTNVGSSLGQLLKDVFLYSK